ncbi:MAG: hypothetical protein GXP27_22350 [Planctomycetes bacterium]|nr:hypothetical protein [Planctomycetota bacterium]
MAVCSRTSSLLKWTLRQPEFLFRRRFAHARINNVVYAPNTKNDRVFVTGMPLFEYQFSTDAVRKFQMAVGNEVHILDSGFPSVDCRGRFLAALVFVGPHGPRPRGTLPREPCTPTKPAVAIWSTGSGQLIRLIHLHHAFEGTVRISPDGILVAVGDQKGELRLFRRSDGACLGQWKAHGARVTAILFRRKPATLISGAEDAKIRFWNIDREIQLAKDAVP